jgi:hypothetical protein
MEILYTMRDVTDAELTSRVQHLVSWVQDLVDQARERQALLDTLRQQREAVSAGPTAVPQMPPSETPAVPEGWCDLHQIAMERRSNARGSWWSHWIAREQRYCKGKA